MTEKKHVINKKNPLGAAVLSTFPGVGLFYLGNYIKGFAYLMVFISLIVLAANSRGAEIPAFVLMVVGFYIFQIFDSFNEAKKTNEMDDEANRLRMQTIPLWTSVSILVVGIILQLASLDIISYRQITRLWPLILIALGIKYIYGYSKNQNVKEGDENE
jgi:TM2 domain-containing membrane protein YozV